VGAVGLGHKAVELMRQDAGLLLGIEQGQTVKRQGSYPAWVASGQLGADCRAGMLAAD